MRAQATMRRSSESGDIQWYGWSSLEELQKKAMHEGLVGKEARTGHMNDY